MRKTASAFLRIAGSPAITVMLGGAVLLSYLTVAVWSKEAFAWVMMQLRGNIAAQLLSVLFVVNVSLRLAHAVLELRSSPARLLLRVPLFLGIALFLASFLLSNSFREFRWQLVGLDDVIHVGSAGEMRVTAVNPAMDEQVLRSDEATGIFTYEPWVLLRDNKGGQFRVGAYPPRSIGGVYLHVLNFGIGPGVELRQDDRIVSRGYMALRLLPFGNTDSFELAPFPYKFYLSMLPVRTIVRNETKMQEYDLKRSRYHVEIVKGEHTVFSGETRDSIAFDANMKLAFFPPSYWVQIEIVRDDFAPWFAGGLLLLLGGAVLYPFSYLAGKRLSS